MKKIIGSPIETAPAPAPSPQQIRIEALKAAIECRTAGTTHFIIIERAEFFERWINDGTSVDAPAS